MRLLIAAVLSALFLSHASSTPVNKQYAHSASTPRVTVAVKTSTPSVKEQTQPEIQTAAVVTPTPEPVAAGTCASEIAKYDWSQTVALAVATAESGLDPGTVNYNPSTYDYSVGCFQINLWGANAYSRPSEAELKDPSINVAWAYKIYAANGHSFIGQWGVCRTKVNCY